MKRWDHLFTALWKVASDSFGSNTTIFAWQAKLQQSHPHLSMILWYTGRPWKSLKNAKKKHKTHTVTNPEWVESLVACKKKWPRVLKTWAVGEAQQSRKRKQMDVIPQNAMAIDVTSWPSKTWCIHIKSVHRWLISDSKYSSATSSYTYGLKLLDSTWSWSNRW